MKKNKLGFLLLGALMMTGLASCNTASPQSEESEDITQPEEIQPEIKNLKISNDSEVANYIKNQDFDPNSALAIDLKPAVALDTKSTGESQGNKLVITKKVQKSATNGSGSLHALEQSEALFPGQLLIADEGLVSGSPTVMSNLNRGQATFDIVLPGLYDSEFTANSTKRTQVRNGIQQKVDEWMNSPKKKKLTAKQTLRVTQVFDQRQAGLDVGFEIANKLNIKADYKQDLEKNIFIVSFEQIFYTVNTSLENDTVVFADDVTKAEVEAEIGNNPLVMITQASYGKMVFFKIETTKDKAEINAAFKYAGCVDVESKAKFQSTLENCNISYLVYGGAVEGDKDPENPQLETITDTSDASKADTLNALLSNSLSSNSSEVENAVMLSYKTSWLKNNKTAKINATAEYVETTRTVINEQNLTVTNVGCFIVSEWNIKARKVKVNEETGDVEFGELETLFTGNNICAPQGRQYLIPASYGRVEFHYDILLGQSWPFKGRISQYDFFENGSVDTGGTTFHNWVRLTIDGRESKI